MKGEQRPGVSGRRVSDVVKVKAEEVVLGSLLPRVGPAEVRCQSRCSFRFVGAR